MAERRMFAKTIIDSDLFLDMPMSSRLLYFDLGMRADDDGFVNNPKKIMRITGVSSDDMNLLIAKKFIIPFESGVVVIRHWKIHNYIRKDTYNETKCKKEKATLLLDENKAYTQDSTALVTSRDETVDDTSTQVRLGKVRLGKDKKKDTFSELLSILNQSTLSDASKSTLKKWLEYKKEKKQTYKPVGFKSLVTMFIKKIDIFGENKVIELVEECMASNWQGIIWDKLNNTKATKKTSSADELQEMIRRGEFRND